MGTSRSGRRRHVILARKFVVGADAVPIVYHHPLVWRSTNSDLRKQDLAIDAVLILFSEPLLGGASASAGFKSWHLLGELRMRRRARCG